MGRAEFSTKIADFNQSQIDTIESAVTDIQNTDLAQLSADVANIDLYTRELCKKTYTVFDDTASYTSKTLLSVTGKKGFIDSAYLQCRGIVGMSYARVKITVDGVIVFYKKITSLSSLKDIVVNIMPKSNGYSDGSAVLKGFQQISASGYTMQTVTDSVEPIEFSAVEEDLGDVSYFKTLSIDGLSWEDSIEILFERANSNSQIETNRITYKTE